MNKLIRKQLEAVRSTRLEFSNDTTNLYIPKITNIGASSLDVGSVYLIELSDDLLDPQVNSTLASNWNNGNIPRYKYYKVELLDKMNNMYKFNGIAYDHGVDLYNENWYGWFPESKFKIIEKII